MRLDPSASHCAGIALERLWPVVAKRYTRHKNRHRLAVFNQALQQDFARLFDCMADLYSDQWDFYFHLEHSLTQAAHAWMTADVDYVVYSAQKNQWMESEQTIGATGYVDLFAGNLSKLHDQIPYLNEMSIGYLHLMPFFDVPEGDSDGGYAIKDYGKINPLVGTMAQMKSVSAALHDNKIRLVLDFVFNHTSDQHQWALAAKAGDPRYQAFYWLFRDAADKAPYSPYLRDIFPDKRSGCFTWNDELQAEVWTTFNDFQWDLNYQNPEVYTAMCAEMLKLVDAGADVIRLDALAFTWKQPASNCENLPKAHRLIQAFNAFLRLAAPGVLLKSEAIVAPDEVVKYISADECPLSYNPNLMALLWEALATRQTKLLIAGSQSRSELPKHTAWVNYLRCHDDIGWAFADADAWHVGINPQDHRYFLNQFYTGQFPGSFATGVPFQADPKTGDCRISGTMASLTGLEQARQTQVPTEHATQRILLLHGIILAFKGIPLIYLGDEVAMLNDYSYRDHPDHQNDSRWVHRIGFAQTGADQRTIDKTPQNTVFTGLVELIDLRRHHSVFGAGDLCVLPSVAETVYAFSRCHQGQRLLVLANFSERPCRLDMDQCFKLGLFEAALDLITNQQLDPVKGVELAPYQQLWLLSGQ
ncbi:alpha-amylase family glycosyl hydrolase [Reinekea sp.]|jgi:amylosucrase|uniref:alpha-amylase family glycosyl hydrolase n=1 Tax=Reinekea sp. TaxID=1970455 RepID=UPI002A7EE6C7|nr:alpha-amylase family glycosyl hydrolase [Reinekea sp.]